MNFFLVNGRRLQIVWQYVYETRIAPWLSCWCSWLWWPLYKLLQHNNICFVVNIAEGTGHVLPELDNFFRGLELGEIDKNKKYVWLRTQNDFSHACMQLYGHRFFFAAVSNFLYDICLPILLTRHDITHDAGISALYWQIPKNWRYTPAPPWQTYLHLGSKHTAQALWRNYYQRRAKNSDFIPLVEYASSSLKPDEKLIQFLEGETSNLVLLHLKTNVMNATAAVTDPNTYLPAIEYLLTKNYRLVFVGREKMPTEFKKFPILNYAEAPIASFLHDLQLFQLADFSITGGSGIAWIADCLNKPVLYLNSWHIFMPPFTANCVVVPTMVKNQAGSLLHFQEQYELHLSSALENGDRFLKNGFAPINANAQEILHGVYELESLVEAYQPLSDEQVRFKKLGSVGWLEYSASRISQYFIRQHLHLL